MAWRGADNIVDRRDDIPGQEGYIGVAVIVPCGRKAPRPTTESTPGVPLDLPRDPGIPRVYPGYTPGIPQVYPGYTPGIPQGGGRWRYNYEHLV